MGMILCWAFQNGKKRRVLRAHFCLYKQNSMLLLVQIYAPSLAQKLSDLLLIPGQTFFAPLFANVNGISRDVMQPMISCEGVTLTPVPGLSQYLWLHLVCARLHVNSMPL